MSKLSRINSTFDDFQKLIDFYEENKIKAFSDIHLEINGFFSANMSAVLGAILDIFASDFNSIHFDIPAQATKTILLKNDFLTYFGEQRALDTNNTTIRYQKLSPTDGKYFKNYIITELIEGHTKNLPIMSDGVKGKIVEAICEIFVNAQIHSEAKYIYTCGQFFPNKTR